MPSNLFSSCSPVYLAILSRSPTSASQSTSSTALPPCFPTHRLCRGETQAADKSVGAEWETRELLPTSAHLVRRLPSLKLGLSARPTAGSSFHFRHVCPPVFCFCPAVALLFFPLSGDVILVSITRWTSKCARPSRRRRQRDPSSSPTRRPNSPLAMAAITPRTARTAMQVRATARVTATMHRREVALRPRRPRRRMPKAL